MSWRSTSAWIPTVAELETTGGGLAVSTALQDPPADPAAAPPVRKRPPLPGMLPILAIGAVVATLVAAWYIDFNLATLVDGLDDVMRLLDRMLPPRLDDPGRIGNLAFETLLMAVLGTVLAAIASVPLAFMAARNTTPHPAVYAVARAIITFCRAMPDLLFAVLFVRALGIGVLPGILALAVHSIGMLGKLFADAIEQTDPGPREAVRSTGVGYFREMINAVVPQVIPAWIGTFVYRIDINLRMSVVLGFVGAGGIGFALQDALRGLIYPRALGIVLVILVIIVAMELLAIWVRRMLLTPAQSNPRRDRVMRFVFSGLLIVTTIASLVRVGDQSDIAVHVGGPVAGSLHPDDPAGLRRAWRGLWEAALQTVAIGVVSTAIGIVLSIPVGILAARNVSPNATVYWLARGWILAVRAVPELILAVVFVAALGLGPIAGTCALAVASIGFLAKLVADAVEEIDPGPMEAVRSVGGGWWKVLFSAVIPQALPSMVGSSLYMFDVNVRTSTILGIVGAGGIGFLLFESIRTVNFEVTGAIVLDHLRDRLHDREAVRMDTVPARVTRAAVWTGSGVDVQNVDLPELGDGETLVRVRLATVCGSDLHTVTRRRRAPCPSVLGHEAVGIVVAGGTRSIAVGDRVVWSVTVSCGRCARCRSGFTAKCSSVRKVGHERFDGDWPLSGAYAEHVVLPAGTSMAKVPDAMPDAVAAPAACATATVMATLEAAGTVAGRRVLVIGAGMLGLTAAAALAEAGARVRVTDIDPERLEIVSRFGGTPDGGGSVDAAIDFSGSSDGDRFGVRPA